MLLTSNIHDMYSYTLEASLCGSGHNAPTRTLGSRSSNVSKVEYNNATNSASLPSKQYTAAGDMCVCLCVSVVSVKLRE